MGRTPSPSTPAWVREKSARQNSGFESSQRRSRQGGAARTELFRVPCWQNELSDHPPSRLAHWLRNRRVGLPPASMPLQTPRTVLDSRRHAPPQRPDRSQTKQPLERTLEHQLIGGSVRMRPSLLDVEGGILAARNKAQI